MSTPRVQSRPTATRAVTAPAPGAPAVHVVTFGCQMNKYDSLVVEGGFRKRGWRVTASMEDADAILFNTCSVRDKAEERVYSWVGELKRAKARRPELVLGVMGCMAQRAQDEIFQRAAHVDLVCGTRQLHHLPALVEELRERRADPGQAARNGARLLEVDMDGDVAIDRGGELYTGGLAGYLTVMRGCDLKCTYCIVPSVRGRVRSRPIAELVDEARWMIDGGARVITLLGQTVNSYGEDVPKPGLGDALGTGRQGRPSLADLLRELQGLDGLERIRLITLHPSYVTHALAEAIADCDKVDRFLPLPAQSGADDVLRRMKRGYDTELFRRRVAILREHVPDIELGSDWIVGFPGETDADFDRSEAFLAEIGFAQGYVFQYSPRPGTAADDLADDVPLAVKKERNNRLLRVVERSGLARMERHVGQTVRVFAEAESDRRAGSLTGRTTHGLPASFEGPPELIGKTVAVNVTEASPYGLAGSRV
jgi:tRNA-2-methylthio-N6-dimethylallyladenosine synthase